MQKYLIAVSILCSIALGQFDREWDEDAKTFCVNKCESYCVNCTEPARCDLDTEKKCGEKPVDPNMSQCTPDDICVPKSCKCDSVDENGDPCPRLCTIKCPEDQIKCGQPKTDTGCLQNDICVHKGFDDNSNLCDGFCPVQCEDFELLCSGPNTLEGCKTPPKCIPKQKDHEDNICVEQQCPLECSESRHKCDGDVDEYGCKENDFCVLRQTSNKGVLCPGVCPVECEHSEILCEGTIDFSDTVLQGCKGQDVCHVKARDENGVYCPADSASHLCPQTCPTDQVLCQPYEGPLGCKGPYVCKERSTNNVNQFCPSSSDCQVHCSTSQYNCPTGIDEDGCRQPDECVEKERGFDGELCPFHCPELCNEEQVFCLGGIDETGCRGPSSCRDKEQHRWGPGAETEPKAECPGYCPTSCETHEILCPSQRDPCNGCPTEQVCREAIKDEDGIFCPGKEEKGKDTQDTSLRRGGFLSYSHNCPKLCREEDGEVLCPAYEDASGCKAEAECKMRVKDDDGDWCPSSSVCEKQCANGYKLCEYETLDSNGCKVEPICIYRGKNNDELYCPGHCPPICSGGETLVSPGKDTDGCELPAICEVAT